ncbi:glycoside hydrolase family 113 [Winogradskyella bathintestinalis]|uniref:Glycoside hydrolase TIM-barrel-like domain-containing protein n=1 Tax=Winogradskyella bathintestinalis TaxID=3035208 RepID=A0ABT7ZQ87_9FLAO|nr:glycoside hydrolase TIM-barrel-like domain-containing protein [Winogradskyella bathintestinalis]MDN3491185.1 glycoside hydrolase TIM-barrel-like domain-containing protein [Winogradskyella bathintestinalis]
MRYFFYSVLFLLFIGCAAVPFKPYKIKGLSLVAAGTAIDSTHTKPVINMNANAVSIMPYGFIRDKSNPEIIYNTERQWFGETKAGAKQYIETLRKDDIEIMIKPHIWLWHGEFTGFLKMNSETNWKRLEQSYTNYILDYAKLAEDVNAEVFCIGTELEEFIKSRPQYWENLIKEIRSLYSGKLTYAANWDEFWHTPFWSDLDYIGIDAYFPISDMRTPTVENCIEGWEKHKQGLKEFSDKLNRPILFTEYGYRSVDYAGKEPWRYDRSMISVNHEAQNNTTQALFDTVWHEDWFAGGYLWKWFIEHHKVGGMDNNQFTPQNKPVEDIIKNFYKKKL